MNGRIIFFVQAAALISRFSQDTDTQPWRRRRRRRGRERLSLRTVQTDDCRCLLLLLKMRVNNVCTRGKKSALAPNNRGLHSPSCHFVAAKYYRFVLSRRTSMCRNRDYCLACLEKLDDVRLCRQSWALVFYERRSFGKGRLTIKKTIKLKNRKCPALVGVVNA